MSNNNVSIKIDASACKKIDEAIHRALMKTVEALHTDVVQSQVMPFDTGTMQNESTYVESVGANEVDLVTSTPYAARMYYHPEYNFSTASNPNAQGRWLDDYISGSKKDFCNKTFAKFMSAEMNGEGGGGEKPEGSDE